jgi:hypothetical protein
VTGGFPSSQGLAFYFRPTIYGRGFLAAPGPSYYYIFVARWVGAALSLARELVILTRRTCSEGRYTYGEVVSVLAVASFPRH